MSIIAKPNTFSPSTTASSSAVNDNFDTIYDEFNGNIGAANIVDGAVTTAKIVDSSVSTAKLADGAVTEAKYDTASSPITRADEMTFDFVASGGVWSGDAYGSTRNASMTALVCYINGQRGTISAVTARSFTASRDTYVDVLNSSGTFSLVYTEVTNNAASPALASNSIRIGIIVTGASNIASVASINQGEETKLLPIASSTPYAVTDSLGNLICPRDPYRKVLGYREATADFTTSSASAVAITTLSVPVQVPTGRKIKVTVFAPRAYQSAVAYVNSGIYEGASLGALTTFRQASSFWQAATGRASHIFVEKEYTPTASTIWLTAVVWAEGGGTIQISSNSFQTSSSHYIRVELV